MSDPMTAGAASRQLVVLVNGLPAAGKTTLARALSQRLSLPLFSKDVIKEAHSDVFGVQSPDGRPQRAWNSQFGAAANATMWALLADSPGGAVLESTWPSRETWGFVQAGLNAAQVAAPGRSGARCRSLSPGSGSPRATRPGTASTASRPMRKNGQDGGHTPPHCPSPTRFTWTPPVTSTWMRSPAGAGVHAELTYQSQRPTSDHSHEVTNGGPSASYRSNSASYRSQTARARAP
jgi:hypothetical protein